MRGQATRWLSETRPQLGSARRGALNPPASPAGLDETIYHYHCAAAELWKFCFTAAGGNHAEFIASLLDRMAAGAQTRDWRERATPP